MSWGSYKYLYKSTIATRSVAGQADIDITWPIATNDVLVVIPMHVVPAGIFTVTMVTGEVTFTERYPEPSQRYATAFTAVQCPALAAGKQVRVAYDDNIGYSQFGVMVFEGGDETEFDLIAKNFYSEDPLLHARDWTSHKETFSVMFGSNTYSGTVIPTTYEDWEFIGQLGVAGASQLAGGMWTRKYTDYQYPSEALDISAAAGAGVDADGFILAFRKGASDPLPAVVSLGEPTTTNTETASVNPGTAFNITIGPAPTAGALLLLAMGFSDDPGAIVNDDYITDGWTLWESGVTSATFGDGGWRFYWKIATGTDDTTPNFQWTNSCRAGLAYVEVPASQVDGTAPLYILPADTVSSGIRVTTSGGDDGQPLPQKPRPKSVWFAFARQRLAVSQGTFDIETDGEPGTFGLLVNAGPGNQVQVRIHAQVIDSLSRPRIGGAPPPPADEGAFDFPLDTTCAMLVWEAGLSDTVQYEDDWETIQVSALGSGR